MVTDTFQRPLCDLRISVTDKCNYRCTYCMPAEVFGDGYRFLANSDQLTFAEIERVARLFVKLGVTKLRLTGGEPLLRPHITDLVARLVSIPGVSDLALTTNGTFLVDKAQALKQAGLQRITVSLDSLDESVYTVMNGRRGSVARVLEGIEEAAAVGISPIKVNCVVKRGVNDHTVVDLARYFQGTGIIVRFIEYMDAGNLNGWSKGDVVPGDAVLAQIDADMPLAPAQPNYLGEVARRYHYLDGSGEIGLVTSVTRPFCGDCSRVRLTAAGELYTCLFGRTAVDLRHYLRDNLSDDELLALVTTHWQGRADRYSEQRNTLDLRPPRGAEMVRMGG